MPTPPSAVPLTIWTSVVSGTLDVPFEYLALKMALARLRIDVKFKSNHANAAAVELRSLFLQLQNVPKVQADLDRLLKKAGFQP